MFKCKPKSKLSYYDLHTTTGAEKKSFVNVKQIEYQAFECEKCLEYDYQEQFTLE